MARILRSESAGEHQRSVAVTGTSGVPTTLAFLESILELHAMAGDEPSVPAVGETTHICRFMDAESIPSPDDGVVHDVVVICQLRRPWVEGDQPLDERRRFSKLVRALRPGGTLVVCGEDSFTAALAGTRLDVRLLQFGLGSDFDVAASVVDRGARSTSLAARIEGGAARVEIPTGNPRAAQWALAAAAAGAALGIPTNTIVTGLERAHLPQDEVAPTRMRRNSPRDSVRDMLPRITRRAS